jgi:hypothetical protein
MTVSGELVILFSSLSSDLVATLGLELNNILCWLLCDFSFSRAWQMKPCSREIFSVFLLFSIDLYKYQLTLPPTPRISWLCCPLLFYSFFCISGFSFIYNLLPFIDYFCPLLVLPYSRILTHTNATSDLLNRCPYSHLLLWKVKHIHFQFFSRVISL